MVKNSSALLLLLVAAAFDAAMAFSMAISLTMAAGVEQDGTVTDLMSRRHQLRFVLRSRVRRPAPVLKFGHVCA
jgi:hypothetical protein